jgi:DNA topoisomerase III
MKLVLAEKPSVARDLARVLGASSKQDGAIAGNGYVVTWCIGHLIELDEPDAYDPAWKRWSWSTLPMLPERFRLRPVVRTRDQWRVVRDLLSQRDFELVINACDAGREGELIFRYAYERAKSRLPIQRLWISSLTPDAIRRGFGELRDGSEYEALAAAARCRSEADWLVGLNATRAMTWAASRRGVHSIGRVQTPTLALIVERELEIRRFVPRDFWEVTAHASKEQETFAAKWTSAEGSTRLAAEALAHALEERVWIAAPERKLRVQDVVKKEMSERAPQLYDLTSLQQTANRRYGFSADRTLRAAQTLYEQYKLITYPRTSSRYLTEEQRGELPELVRSFEAHPLYGVHAKKLAQGPLPISKRIVDDSKVGDHHAIIPTGARAPELPEDERKLYDLIVRRFLATFHPDARFLSTEILLVAGKGGSRPKKDQEARDAILETLPPPPDRFVARGRVVIDPGWQAVEPPKSSEEQTLPDVKVGELLPTSLELGRGRTQPPRRHNDASLLGAMETAGKRVEEEALREAMKDCGLGTPATRASIIETLIQREYVRREKKTLVPTEKGIELIERLPVATLRSAELTGEWEARLLRISRGVEPAASFMADVTSFVKESVERIRAAKQERIDGPATSLGRCPRCGGDVVEQRSSYECSACPFSIPKYLAGRNVEASEASVLLRERKTARLSGFRSKKKKRFAAALVIEEGEVRFAFARKKDGPAAQDNLQRLICPRCGKEGIVSGRRAWGCARWRTGCTFTVPYVFEGKKLTAKELEDLLSKGKTRKARFGDKRGRIHLEEGQPRLEIDAQ